MKCSKTARQWSPPPGPYGHVLLARFKTSVGNRRTRQA